MVRYVLPAHIYSEANMSNLDDLKKLKLIESTRAIWKAMMQRCYQSSNGAYYRYGDKGVQVCERWHKYENFLADMGVRPSFDHSIDREKNDKGYEPLNCRWVLPTTQSRNRSNVIMLTLDGETKCLSEWAEITGISRDTIYMRIRNKWTIEEALTTPKGGSRK